MSKFKDDFQKDYTLKEIDTIIEDLKRAKKYGKKGQANVCFSNIGMAKLHLDALEKYVISTK